jgi:hypothetical protein
VIPYFLCSFSIARWRRPLRELRIRHSLEGLVMGKLGWRKGDGY